MFGGNCGWRYTDTLMVLFVNLQCYKINPVLSTIKSLNQNKTRFMVSYNFKGISGCLSTLMFVLLSIDAKHEIVA